MVAQSLSRRYSSDGRLVEGIVMQMSLDAIFEATLMLPEGDRWELVSRILATLPPDDVTMSIDDPLLPDELRRRWNDGTEPIPWPELRAEN
jgi:hypothetical protein